MKEIKWIYQGDSEEESFLEDICHFANLIFGDISEIADMPKIAADYNIFDLHGIGIYCIRKELFGDLKRIWKESILLREYRKEENQYLIG